MTQTLRPRRRLLYPKLHHPPLPDGSLKFRDLVSNIQSFPSLIRGLRLP
jgi:hypothetical protein